ncbi:MAG: STAS domain-containing protein [Candidatus Promineifilaceae bacterium]|nr:STAS domain-containing protein [Candidatus Promineifilaceae bacterium]
MDIEVVQEQAAVPVTVLRLSGDLASEEPLLSQARSAHQEGARHLLLDLSEVPFISSAGLRAIHQIFDLYRDVDAATVRQGISTGSYKSAHVKLLKPSKNARKALDVAGYDMFLEIHQDYRQALQSFE